MNEDDFSAPLPEPSWQMRVIQVIALLTAVSISVCFLAVILIVLIDDEKQYTDSDQSLALLLFKLTSLLILILVPCWRCWLLRRWACFSVIALLLGFAIVTADVGLVTGLPCLFATTLMIGSIMFDWHNLKSGF